MQSSFVDFSEEQLDFPVLFNYSYSVLANGTLFFLGFLDADNMFFFSLCSRKTFIGVIYDTDLAN